ncbi:MAG: hypothetical protein WAM97_15170 [Acidimicrobiales bacterium]
MSESRFGDVELDEGELDDQPDVSINDRFYTTSFVGVGDVDIDVVSVPARQFGGLPPDRWLNALGLEVVNSIDAFSHQVGETRYLYGVQPTPEREDPNIMVRRAGDLIGRQFGFQRIPAQALEDLLQEALVVTEESPPSWDSIARLIATGGTVGGAVAASAAMGPIGFVLVPAGVFLILVAEHAGPKVGDAIGDYVKRVLRRKGKPRAPKPQTAG